MRNHLWQTSEYLIKYFQGTNIDPLISINQVLAEVQQDHNRLRFQALKKLKGHEWTTTVTPTVFVAQSPDDVYIKIQLQEGMD